MNLYFQLIRALSLATLLTFSLCVCCQETYLVEEDYPDAAYTLPEMEVKVTWFDTDGKKHRTKGYLLVALDHSVMIRQVGNTGRSVQHTFPIGSIHKIKYSQPRNESLDVLAGAADGLLSGGIVPISTGNVYFDLLSGAVQGAAMGLVSILGDSKSVVLEGSKEIYRSRVLPDLRPDLAQPLVID